MLRVNRFKAQGAELEAAKTREEYEAILLKYGAEPEMWERDLIGGQQEGERPKDIG